MVDTAKKRLSVTISPYLKDRIVNCVEKREFSSESELTTVALSEFFGRFDHMKSLDQIQNEIEKLNSKLKSLEKKVEENNKKQPNP